MMISFPWTVVEGRRALSRTVLAVARTRVEGTWKAYIDSVPGLDHGDEASEVLKTGSEMPKDIACSLFPEFADIPYAR